MNENIHTQTRERWASVVPEAFRSYLELESYSSRTGLSATLRELVKLLASNINHCAFCIDMHWKDLRALGETEQRLYGLNGWRESPYYSAQERAAFEWTEAVTLLTEGYVSDEVYETVKPHFTSKELVELTMIIVTINGWNRLSVAFRTEAGTYEPKHNKSE